MLQNPSKYHQNPLTHFLSLHRISSASPATTATATTTATSILADNIDMDNNATDEQITHLESISGNIGKSFTIAAILGLQKNVVAAAAAAEMEHNQHHHHHHHHQHQLNHRHYQNNKEFSVMNLSLNNYQNMRNNLNSSGANSYHNNNNNNNNSNNSESDNSHNIIGGSVIPISLGQHFNVQNHHNHHPNSAASAIQGLHHQLHQQQQHGGSGGGVSGVPNTYHGRERAKNENASSKKSSLKSKRVRTIFTPEQLERLESEFERQQYMVGPERLYLAHTLQLTEAQVKVWFQNRRIKWRKHHLELTQQRLALIRQHQLPNSRQQQQQQQPEDSSTLQQPQQMPQESELSVCTDSMDTVGSCGQDEDL